MSAQPLLRRRALLARLAALAALPGLSACRERHGRPRAGREPDHPLRGVSLRVLQSALTAGYRHTTCTPQALSSLGGLARLDGFVIDRAKRDLVLFGPRQVSPARPALRTSDWVHTLRSATHRYLDAQGRFSHPGVSIDPRAEVMHALLRFDAAGLNATGAEAERTAQAWGRICSQAQDVRAVGLQREGLRSALLASIEFADETMKSIVDGTLAVPGIEVPSRVLLQRHEEALRLGRQAPAGGWRMSRYWFNAGTVRCGVDELSCQLLQCEVQLSTEAQMMSARGLQDSGGRDELAERCAASFTAALATRPTALPACEGLHDIYRLQALATSVVQRHAERDSGLALDPLLDLWPVPEAAVPAAVPGRWAVQGADFRFERAGGQAIASVRIPSCGGVTVNPAPRAERSRQAGACGRAVLAARPQAAGDPLYWDLPEPAARV